MLGQSYLSYAPPDHQFMLKIVSIFVSLSIKAVHLEIVFLTAFRCFIVRRGNPNVMWSDHGTDVFCSTLHLLSSKSIQYVLQYQVSVAPYNKQNSLSQSVCDSGEF